jgi:TRAP-type C4-dicarboxylate transport system permease small subunit
MLLHIRTGIDLAIRWISFGLIAALLLCVIAGVISRELNDPLIFTDEMSRFLMIWVAVFGWLLASRRRAHIRIRFFQDLLPKPAWRAAEIFIQCGIVLLGVLLAWYSVELVERNHDMEALTVSLSLAWMYIPMVLAGLLTVGQAAVEISELLQRQRPPAGDEGLVE